MTLELSACRITWQRPLTCTVQDTFEDILVCVGLRRIVTVAFLRREQILFLTYLLKYQQFDLSFVIHPALCVLTVFISSVSIPGIVVFLA